MACTPGLSGYCIVIPSTELLSYWLAKLTEQSGGTTKGVGPVEGRGLVEKTNPLREGVVETSFRG